jgi:diaminopimelate epimerase
VAAALVAGSLGHVSSPVEVLTRGGDRLVVSFKREGEQFMDLHLEGAAEVVCEGMLHI